MPISAPGSHVPQTLTLEDMLNETKMMASLGAHPNLLGLVGMLVAGAEPCIAMDLCGGAFFFFTLVAGPRRSLSLKPSGARVYEPTTQIDPEHKISYL